MRISRGGTFLFAVDPKDYDLVVKSYLDGKSVKELYTKFDCSRMTIQRILLKKNVKHRWNRMFQVQDDFFSKIDSEVKAYILGFLYADGYNNEKMGCLEIALQKNDRLILEQMAKCFTKKHLYEDDNIVRLSIYSKQISSDLKRLGCPQAKSLILTFPSYKLVPKQFISHFMRGYFDGDGCVYIGKSRGKYVKVSFDICGTLDFLERFKDILKKETGMEFDGHIKKVGNIYRLWIQSRKDIQLIAKFLYKDSSIFLERKRIKMEAI